MSTVTDTEAVRMSAHVLIDAVHAYSAGLRESHVVAVLEALGSTGAVTCTPDDDGTLAVNVQPLLRAAMTVMTSLLTMVEVSEPAVDAVDVLDRLRSVVDLNALL